MMMVRELSILSIVRRNLILFVPCRMMALQSWARTGRAAMALPTCRSVVLMAGGLRREGHLGVTFGL